MNTSDTSQFDQESYERAKAAFENFYHPEDTPFQRALRAFRARQQAYEQEMIRLHNGGKDLKGKEGWNGLRRN